MIYIFQYTDLLFICKKNCKNFCLLFQKILALKVMTRVKDRVKSILLFIQKKFNFSKCNIPS